MLIGVELAMLQAQWKFQPAETSLHQYPALAVGTEVPSAI